MMAVVELVASNPVFADFAFYVAITGLKMLFMGFWIGSKRFSLEKFANPEDYDHKKMSSEMREKALKPDERIERVRRNHQNDLENIPLFWIFGLVYTLTDPSRNSALWHFRVFAFSRIFHTLAYQFAFPQPSRAIGHLVGVVVNISMAVQIINNFW